MRYGSSPKTIEGIIPSTLPLDCLKQVSFYKLLDCIDEDPRINDIVCDKLNDPDFNVDNLREIGRLNTTNTFARTNLKQAYNNCIKQKRTEIERKSYYNRESYVKLPLLNEENIKLEIESFLDEKDSVISYNNIDYSLALKYYPAQTQLIIDNTAASQTGHTLERMISTLPKDELLNICPVIDKRRPNIKVLLLTSAFTSPEYTVKALRSITTTVPTVKAFIDLSIIEQLPSIKRLDVLEILINYNQIDWVKNIQRDKLADLLFPSTIKYSDRVSRVLKRIELITQKREFNF